MLSQKEAIHSEGWMTTRFSFVSRLFRKLTSSVGNGLGNVGPDVLLLCRLKLARSIAGARQRLRLLRTNLVDLCFARFVVFIRREYSAKSSLSSCLQPLLWPQFSVRTSSPKKSKFSSSNTKQHNLLHHGHGKFCL